MGRPPTGGKGGRWLSGGLGKQSSQRSSPRLTPTSTDMGKSTGIGKGGIKLSGGWSRRGGQRSEVASGEGGPTFLEELETFEHTLLWRDTFSALEICTRLIRTAGGLGLNTRFLGCGRLEAIFLKVMDMAYGHKGSDSQMIINMVYRTFDALSHVSFIRKKCLESLCKICSKNNLLPRVLHVDLPLGPADAPHCRGGFGDVLKRLYQGREVAVKVLRVSPNCDLRKIARRFQTEVIAWKALDHPNIVPLLGITEDGSQLKFAMMSEWMANGNLNQFVKAHLDANRFKLLGDAASGLIYLHDWGMVHGDLKGDNILVDETGNARLTDFGLVTMNLDSTTSGSYEEGGSSRWMSPELFEPGRFDVEDSRRTKSSDCYALGMTVYEVLTGQIPFSRYAKYPAITKILRGERPERPQGPEGKWFIDHVWGILGRCWEPKPGNRPSIRDVFEHLKGASTFWTPLPPLMEEGSQRPDLPPWTLSVLSAGGTNGRAAPG